jgi:hypothetical protein
MNVYQLFRERLEAEYPDLLEKVDKEVLQKKSHKRKWVEESDSADFSFDFFGS